ncbi:MAG: site-specific DNA-methyltransferase [Deltaproteobacteria bacterium]|nr:site-specific DNA-methyltransferase [Deltaproteobacteria bacterium]
MATSAQLSLALPRSRRVSFGSPALPPNLLVRGDARDVLAAQAPGSLDVIYIDPPFATGRTQRGRAGAYDDRAPLGDFLPWLAERLRLAHRALADTGSLLLHLDYRAVHHARVELERIFLPARGLMVNEIVWAYSVGGKGPRAFGRKHDTILWFARSPRYAFFPDAVRVPRRPGSHMRVKLDEAGAPIQEKTDRKTGRVYRYPVAAGKVPEDVWTDIETLNRSDRERTGWPSQKPERLLTRLLGATCPPGGRVGDVFVGSGTTAVVAQRLGFGFVCGDASADAVAVAEARITRAARDSVATGPKVPDLVLATL